MVPAPLDVTCGKYRLLGLVASGALAEAFLAEAAEGSAVRRPLVLERLRAAAARDADRRRRFLDDARAASELEHPNLVCVIDLGEADGTAFVVTERVDGPDARALVRAAAAAGRPVPFAHAARIVASACEGVQHAHGAARRLVHGGLAPGDIQVSRRGAVKVSGFGSTLPARPDPAQAPRGALAPERLRGLAVDGRADVYGLGAVLLELLAGELPGQLEEAVRVLGARRPDCPRALAAVVERALQPDRERRFADCRSMQLALEEYLVDRRSALGATELALLVSELCPTAPPPAQPAAEARASASAETLRVESPLRQPPPDLPDPHQPIGGAALSSDGALAGLAPAAPAATAPGAGAPLAPAAEALELDLELDEQALDHARRPQESLAHSFAPVCEPGRPALLPPRRSPLRSLAMLVVVIGAAGVGYFYLRSAPHPDAAHAKAPARPVPTWPLRVDTVPPGAKVRIGEEVVGVTPLVGTHHVGEGATGTAVVELSGYKPVQVEILGGRSQKFQLVLQRAMPVWMQ